MENLNLLLKRLLEAKLDFVLIGGYAAVLHGASQVTHDLDICAVMTKSEFEKLKAALSGLEPRHRMNPSIQLNLEEHPKDPDDLENYFLKTNAGVLDVLRKVPPAGTFDEIKQRSVSVQIFGYDCRVISLDDLIQIKQGMHRPKDRAVLDELLEVKRRVK